MAFNSFIKNNYEKTKKEYLYKVPSGLATSFFINSDPLIIPGFNNLRLSIFDGYGTEVISDVAPLQQVLLPTGGFRIYAENIIVTNLLDNTTYRFVIYDITSNQVLFKLNCFQFVLDASKYTRISYRNSTNIFNFNYKELPNYRNVHFVDLNQIDGPADYNLSDYDEASTGNVRAEKSQLKDVVVLEGFRFDRDASFAMKGFSMHDDIDINLRPYQVKEGYEIDTDIRTNRSKGTIELYDQSNNQINLNG